MAAQCHPRALVCLPSCPPACCNLYRGTQSGEPLWKLKANLSTSHKWWLSGGSGWAINVQQKGQSMRYWVSELFVFCLVLFWFGLVFLYLLGLWVDGNLSWKYKHAHTQIPTHTHTVCIESYASVLFCDKKKVNYSKRCLSMLRFVLWYMWQWSIDVSLSASFASGQTH